MAKIIVKRNNMKKIFISIFLISFVFNFANAEDLNNSKSMTKEEFLKKMQQLENEKQNTKAKTIQLQKEANEAKELGKTIDEIKDKLNVK